MNTERFSMISNKSGRKRLLLFSSGWAVAQNWWLSHLGGLLDNTKNILCISQLRKVRPDKEKVPSF